ncbi:MAG: VWA domain-containing protein, partial [Thermodesulfobacteriota bacterium]
MRIFLESPQALALALPLLWFYFRRMPSRSALRFLMLLLAVLLLARPAIRKSGDFLNLSVVVDRSRSIPAAERRKEAEILDLIKGRLRADDRVSVVSFNSQPYVESPPGSSFSSFSNPFSEQASDLSSALSTALALVSGEGPGR